MSTDKKIDSNAVNIDLSGYEGPGYETGAPYPPNDKYPGYYPNKPDCKHPGHCPTAPDYYPDAPKYSKNTFTDKLKKMLHQKVTVYTLCKVTGSAPYAGRLAASRDDCCCGITGILQEVGEDYIVMQKKERYGREIEMCIQCMAIMGVSSAEYNKYSNQEAGLKASADDYDKVPEL